MKWLIVALGLGLVSPRLGHAQNAVLDPNGVLPQLRQFVGAISFASAFRCGDVGNFTFFRFSCSYTFDSSGGIEEVCDEAPTTGGLPAAETVYNCTTNSVSILTDLTANSVDLTQTAYSTANNDMIEVFLSQAATFGGYPNAFVTVTSLQSTTYTLGSGTPTQRTVPAVNVIGTLAADGEPAIDILITVIQNVPGVAQIARYRQNNATWYMLNDFTAATGARR